MKKQILSLLLTSALLTSCVIATTSANITTFSRKFTKNFKDCNTYEETINSTYEGTEFTTHRKIVGWKNRFCKYEEKISSKDGNYMIQCLFPEIQVEELYNASKKKSDEISDYELDIFDETTDSKTGLKKYNTVGKTTISGNLAYITWAKYQNNPYFCKATKL